MSNSQRDTITAFWILSAAHLLTFALSIYVLLPIQAPYTPDFAPYASLFFLPHGVRVLSAWLLGWKAIPLFLPTAFFTHWLNFGASGFALVGLAGVVSGVICAVVTFWLLAKVGMDFRLTANRKANWRDVALAGSIASFINTFGMGWAFQHNVATLAGYFIGDITGMFACMIFLMLLFRFIRE